MSTDWSAVVWLYDIALVCGLPAVGMLVLLVRWSNQRNKRTMPTVANEIALGRSLLLYAVVLYLFWLPRTLVLGTTSGENPDSSAPLFWSLIHESQMELSEALERDDSLIADTTDELSSRRFWQIQKLFVMNRADDALHRELADFNHQCRIPGLKELRRREPDTWLQSKSLVFSQPGLLGACDGSDYCTNYRIVPGAVPQHRQAEFAGDDRRQPRLPSRIV